MEHNYRGDESGKERSRSGHFKGRASRHDAVYYQTTEKKYSTKESSVYYYEGLPANIAEKLMTGLPNIDPEDTENWSPKAREMIKIAKEHDGQLIGRVSTRPDEEMRITVTGFEIKVTDYAARKIRKELTQTDNGPDEFIKVKRRRGVVWRFWWD